jgi:Membrane-associated lipoprotein involved in thiamine biosynthesis
MTTPTMTSPAAPLERKAWVEQVMGMPVSIHLRGHELSRPRAVEAVRAAYATLRRLDGIFSTYRPDSEVMRLQRGEVSIGQCCVEVREVLAIGEQAERRTGGAFTTLLPTGAGELAFDPTGLVKGWAVDVVARELAGLSDVSYCINAGGDLLIGAHPDVPLSGSGSISWRVGIEDPRDRSAIVRTVPMTHGAVATSGTAARGAHLYDPATGEYVGRSGSVTVIGPELVWADIWATALFVGGEPAREAFALAAPDYLSTVL